MRTLLVAAILSTTAMAAPASAAIVGFEGMALTSTPTTVFSAAGNSFLFSYDPTGSFDLSPFKVQTTGTAQVSSFGGFLGIPLTPSQFFTGRGVVVGPDLFTNWAGYSTPTAIPNSIVEGDLALRYQVGADFFYGVARTSGNRISLAFQTEANTALDADAAIAAVPEPASWAMMIAGFGLAGAALRRRRPVALAA